MTTRKKRDPLVFADAHPSSREAASLPIVMELAIMLESVALFLPDGAARLPEVAAEIFTKKALFGAGSERRTAGEIIDGLFRAVPVLLRSWAPNVPECSTFVLDEDGVFAWLRRWARDNDASDERLAPRADELQTALTQRIRRWAGSDRDLTGERTHGDRLPEGLDSFLRRHARQIAVVVAPDASDRLVVRLQWSNRS